jgi:hypothetical protein
MRATTEKAIRQTINEFRAKYGWHIKDSFEHGAIDVGDAINSGLCDLFAEAVKKRIPEATICYDGDKDHNYLQIRDRYYDAENPGGVISYTCMRYGGKTPKGCER